MSGNTAARFLAFTAHAFVIMLSARIVKVTEPLQPVHPEVRVASNQPNSCFTLSDDILGCGDPMTLVQFKQRSASPTCRFRSIGPPDPLDGTCHVNMPVFFALVLASNALSASLKHIAYCLCGCCWRIMISRVPGVPSAG